MDFLEDVVGFFRAGGLVSCLFLIGLPALASGRQYFKGGHLPNWIGIVILIGCYCAIMNRWINLGPLGEMVRERLASII